jgi:hypothetical protein
MRSPIKGVAFIGAAGFRPQRAATIRSMNLRPVAGVTAKNEARKVKGSVTWRFS